MRGTCEIQLYGGKLTHQTIGAETLYQFGLAVMSLFQFSVMIQVLALTCINIRRIDNLSSIYEL